MSNKSKQQMVDLDTMESCPMKRKELLKGAEGKDVLLLIHGYNNTFSSAADSYKLYAEKIENHLENTL